MANIYTTMMTPDYIPDWGVEDGIREFVANALDSDYPFTYDVGDDYIVLTSVGVTLPATVLTLGTSGNRLKDSAVGKHGEGILTGIIPILRDGGEVVFSNGDKTWTPSFQHSEQFDREILVIEETLRSRNSGNFSVEIRNVDSRVIEEVVSRCLYLQEDLGTVYEGERGRVLMDKVGKLYVGGLYVCDITGYNYSFDFAPAHLPLNRDRRSVDSWNLAGNVTKLLEEVLPATECALLVNSRANDAGGYYSSFTSDEIAEEVYNLIKKSHGETVVVCEDYDEKEKLEKRGFKNVQVVYNDNQRKLIKQAPTYQEFLEELEKLVDAAEPEDPRSPIEMLNDWYRYKEETFEELMAVFEKRGLSFDS